MQGSPVGRYAASASELKARQDLSRDGTPVLAYRNRDGAQQLVALVDGDRFTIGRSSTADVCLEWDDEVSRIHAALERVGNEWTIVDDGISRNGSYVNRERLVGRRRLRDGDVLRFGSTQIGYVEAAGDGTLATRTSTGAGAGVELTPAQRRVLIALCRPLKGTTRFTQPAGNQQIADELCLSIDAVKTHMRTLFARLSVDGLPQNQKRAALAKRALETGVVCEWEL